MRELKFRAFIHPDCGGGIPQECYNSMDYSDNHNGDLEDFFSLYKPYFFHVMQFTGLKDKNGIEIYEGDFLLKNNNHKYIVDYNGCSFGISNPHLIQVIGNIHENPELL